MSCGVGRRRGLDPALLWLWRRLAATALIQPLAWEPPYAIGAAQEMVKRPKKKKNKVRQRQIWYILLFGVYGIFYFMVYMVCMKYGIFYFMVYMKSKQTNKTKTDLWIQ